jgi:hypothetical protein
MSDDHTLIIQDLYDNEINARIEWLHDAGFAVALGDRLKGFIATAQVTMYAEAVDWLRVKAIELYPTSDFARWYRR